MRNFTQEPNHIAKLNKQAEKIIAQHDLEKLKKSQFRRFINEHIHRLLGIEIENRADIVRALKQLNGVQSVKAGKNYLTVTLNNNDKHRLKGAFYDEKFELGAYAERLREAESNKPTDRELAAALTDADQLRETYRAKRAAYHEQYHPFKRDREYDKIHRIESKLDFDRGGESITTSAERSNNGLSSSVKSNPRADIEYRYIETPTAFSLNRIAADRNQQSNWQHFDRSEEHPSPSPGPSEAGDRREPKRANRDRNSVAIKLSKSQIHDMGEYSFWGADDFNQFLYDLSVQYKPKNHPSTKRNDSTEFTNNSEPTQLPKQHTEISYADRDRPIFDRAKRLVESTKQLVSRTKRSLESTGQFIKEYFDHLQRSRAEFKGQNQQLELRERSSTSLDFGYESRTFKARAGRIFGAITASISRKLENPVTNAINDSIKSTGFKQHCQRPGKDRIKIHSTDARHTADRPGDSTLNHLAIAATHRLLHRLGDAKQADQYAWGNCRTINDLNQQLEQLEPLVAKIRPKPKPATDFRDLRIDAYYPGYVADHKQLSAQQQQAYNDNNLLQLIDCVQKKAQNLEKYISQASRMINTWDYDKIEEIIKNDQRMLNYLKCEIILEPQNDHLKHQRASYQSCLESFENIKSHIHEVKKPNPTPQSDVLEQTYEPEKQPNRDYDLDF